MGSTNIPITFTKVLLTGQTAVQQQKKEINVYDLYTYISQQKSIPLKQQQSVKLHFSNLDGAYIRSVSVHIWRDNGEKTKLFVKNNEFKVPKNQGLYVVDIAIDSTRATMQYAANVQIQ